jgi:hypothetical protein
MRGGLKEYAGLLLAGVEVAGKLTPERGVESITAFAKERLQY